MVRLSDCRVLLPAKPIVLGEGFEARLEIAGAGAKRPIGPITISMVGTAAWRGLRRRETEFFRMEASGSQDRSLDSGSLRRTIHFEPPRTLPLPFVGERLSIRYELVVETTKGELRADLNIAFAEPREKKAYPSFRARMNESMARVEVAVASQGVAPGNDLVGELSIESREPDGVAPVDVSVQLVRSESWNQKVCEVVVLEALVPAQPTSLGASRAFLFALPGDTIETIARPSFSCTWALRFDVPVESSRVAFDVPVEVRRDAAEVGYVPRVGSARRSAALEKYAEPPFYFVNGALSAQHGVVEADVVYENKLHVSLRYPSLGLSPRTTDPEHTARCHEQLLGEAQPRLRAVSDRSAELAYLVSDDQSIRDVLREVSALMARVDDERLRLPAPPAHRVSLGSWRELAEETKAELLPAGPRVQGSLRGRAFVVEPGMTGVRLSLHAPTGNTRPRDLPEVIRRELDRTTWGSLALEGGWIVLSTPRSMGSGASLSAWEAAKLLAALGELANEWTRSGPYR